VELVVVRGAEGVEAEVEIKKISGTYRLPFSAMMAKSMLKLIMRRMMAMSDVTLGAMKI
jgi:hypothetical protein